MTGVCHGRIDLRDSVDDEEANPDEAWRMLVACPGKLLQCFSHVRIETRRITVHWLQVASKPSIDRTSNPAIL